MEQLNKSSSNIYCSSPHQLKYIVVGCSYVGPPVKRVCCPVLLSCLAALFLDELAASSSSSFYLFLTCEYTEYHSHSSR